MKNFMKVDQILHRIRDNYDTVTEYLPKGPYLKRSFEDRYLETLKGKTNLEIFLKGEEVFLKQFLREAEEIEARQNSYKERNADGFAEGIMKEFISGIDIYPSLPTLHESAIKEVSKLYGAIHEYIENYWDALAYFISGVNADMDVEVNHLERSLGDVYSVISTKLPKAVESYNEMLVNKIGTKPERVRATQETIHHAGLWLNRLREAIRNAIKYSHEETPPDIKDAKAKLAKMIENFRLEAFAKRNR